VKKVTKISNIFTKSKMDLFCLFLYYNELNMSGFFIVVHIYGAKWVKNCWYFYFLILNSRLSLQNL